MSDPPRERPLSDSEETEERTPGPSDETLVQGGTAVSGPDLGLTTVAREVYSIEGEIGVGPWGGCSPRAIGASGGPLRSRSCRREFRVSPSFREGSAHHGPSSASLDRQRPRGGPVANRRALLRDGTRHRAAARQGGRHGQAVRRAGPPAPLETRQEGVPEDLLAIVRKAIASRRDERYPTARSLADDLRRFQTGEFVGARRYSAGQLVSGWARGTGRP